MTLNESNNFFKVPSPKQMQLVFSESGTEDIILNNSDICSEEMDLEESLCAAGENLIFGSCDASCFKVKVVNGNTFIGKTVEVKMNQTISYGRFKVYSDKPTGDRMWRELVCYDAMYDILNADVTNWYKSLTFPMTIQNLRNSFFNYLGINQVDTNLVNDNFITYGGFLAESLKGQTIIEAICELNGSFGHINREGLFEYIILSNNIDLTYDWYIDGTVEYEDYITDTITGIIARSESGDVGTNVGTNTNPLIIENNPLIYGQEGTVELTTALNNILNLVGSIVYRPLNIETYGNPVLSVGSRISFNVKKYDTNNGYTSLSLNTIVMNRTLTGIQGLDDKISATGEKKRENDSNSLNSLIQRTMGKVNVLKNEVDEFSIELQNFEDETNASLDILSNEIVLKVNSQGRMVEVELGTDPDDSGATIFQVTADNISFFANNTMEMTANNIAINSTYFQVDDEGHVTAKSFTAPGQIFTTIIEPDVMDVVNNLDDDVYVSIVAQAFTRPLYGDEYTSGQINISDGDYESHLTSRDLFINMVNANQVNVLGTYHRVIEDLYDCGYMISVLNEETDLYSGFIRLSGEDADIQINEKSALHFEDGEPFYCDFRGAGFITTNASKVWFTIGIPKSAYGKTISCVDFVGRVRVDGKYIFGTRNTMPPIVATANVTSDGYHLQVALTRGVDAQQNLIPYGNKKKLNNRVVGIDVDGTFIFSDHIPEVVEEEEEA